MAQVEAGSADRGRWNRSPPVARIANEHGDGIRALMAVDDGESHRTENDRSAHCPADHSRTISIAAKLLEQRLHRGGLILFYSDINPSSRGR
jgi:hypothetical protein